MAGTSLAAHFVLGYRIMSPLRLHPVAALRSLANFHLLPTALRLIFAAFLLLPMACTPETPSTASTATPAIPADAATAVFGGGCFWCVEALFERLPGVLAVKSGYANGQLANPTYEQVCAGTTGHAEVVRVTYDPAHISYRQLVDYFWAFHDPTTLNRQGADVGTQYRSIIAYASPAERETAIASRDAAQPQFGAPIVTEIVALDVFYPAEGYHQDYFARNPNAPYCRYVIAPKVQKLEQSQAN
jgi:peptide-methionine (S)-S-oxide reductase